MDHRTAWQFSRAKIKSKPSIIDNLGYSILYKAKTAKLSVIISGAYYGLSMIAFDFALSFRRRNLIPSCDLDKTLG